MTNTTKQYLLLIIVQFFILSSTYATTDRATRVKSYRLYKIGLKEFKKQNYPRANKYISRAIKLFPGSRRYRQTQHELRTIGLESFKNGVALIYFNTELALNNLKQAKFLLHPKDRRQKKITKLIKNLSN